MEMAKDAGISQETKEYIFKVLSPVHIKNQISIREIGLETIKDPNDENKYYIIDVNKLIKELVRQNPGKIDDVEKAIRKLDECIRDYKVIKKKKINSILDIIDECNLAFNEDKLKNISKGYFIHNKKGSFISDANGKYYVPGSSIKGAIRTALMWKVLKDKKGNTIDKIVKRIHRKDKKNPGAKLEHDVFRSINLSGIENEIVNDIMRCIKVYDCYEFSEAMSTKDYECFIISTRRDKTLNYGHISGYSEKCYKKNKDFHVGTCLHPGQEVKVRIILDRVLLNEFKSKGTIIFESIEQVMDIVEKFYRMVAAEELEIAKDYNNKCDNGLSLQNIIDFYTENRNKCTFRLGYGIGAMSTSVRSLISQDTAIMIFGKKGEKVPKSRRFVRVKGDKTYDNILPFGWMTFEQEGGQRE